MPQGQNIGQVALRVFLRNKSPFGFQNKQETAHYFTEDTFRGLKGIDGVIPLPPGINGIRLDESLNNFDNFLVDQAEVELEKAIFTSEVKFTDPKTNKETTQEVNIELDPTAAARIDELGLAKKKESQAQTPQAPSQGQGQSQGQSLAFATPQQAARLEAQASSAGNSTKSIKGATDSEKAAQPMVSEEQKSFFTWQLAADIFDVQPRKFSDPPELDGVPEWTYVTRQRPGDKSRGLLLTPFMRKLPPDTSTPVHWGLRMKEALAQNQPFELTYYQCITRDLAIPRNANALTTKFEFLSQQGQVLKDLGEILTRGVYLGIEIGIGTQKQHLLMLFIADHEPLIFQIAGSDERQQAVLLATFNGFNSNKLFDSNHKFFTVSIEPVLGSLIIRSNVFDKTPWIIQAPTERPLFVGAGPLALYGGNMQAGLAMRPIQYLKNGKFSTPKDTFTIIEKGVMPTCTTATKGGGDIEQDRTYKGKDKDDPQVHQVDAEKVNGEDITTPLEAAGTMSGNSAQREVKFDLIQVNDPDTDPAAQPGGDNTPQISKSFKIDVNLMAGDMEQGNGFVVTSGRSPYLFMLRCELDPAEGEPPGDIIDISSDVMSVDLSWNATSYQEIQHTGSIKVLNKRRADECDSGIIEFRSLTNRAIYVRIEAWWQNGVGHDPEGNRQVFEGLTTGATIDTQHNRETITFRIEDYMNVLRNSKFVLSPFYDGMKASLAVRDIVLQTGLSDSRIFSNDKKISEADLSQDYGLPFANPFEEPLFRFKDGSSFKDAILKIAKKDFKSVFFDRSGNFHYDTMPGGIFATADQKSSVDFFSSPKNATSSVTPANLVWNLTSFTRLINDVYNVIQVSGVLKRLLARITGAQAYHAGIADPSAEGYLGYRKHLMISDAALGSVDGVFRYLDNYRRRVIIPPLTAKFEIYGFTGLQPLNIISLDGQPLRILNLNTHISAAENQYWTNVEGEWFFSNLKGDDPRLFNDNIANDKSVVGTTAGENSTR